MERRHSSDPHASRYRIAVDGGGYTVTGDGVRIWEEELCDAAAWRNELESTGWRSHLLPAVAGRHSRPPGAVVYGPVVSRRFGRSLGIDLTPPGSRICSFDCIYCEFRTGRLDRLSDAWPTPAGITAALAKALGTDPLLDSITISGHGEPTLHPDFAAVVGAVLDLTRRVAPGVPVRVLSNGSGAVDADVRRALDRLDERVVTLDAGASWVDQPAADHPVGSIVLALALLRDVTIQSCFISGALSNCDDEVVGDWADLLGEVGPRAVQIFTIDRRPGNRWVRPVSNEKLREIASVLHGRTGIRARVFW